MKQVGMIGLGIMGAPMAANLVKAGFEVFGYDVSVHAVEKAKASGVKIVDSAQKVGERAQWVITMLPNTSIVEEAIFGHDGLIHSLPAGSTVIDESSITPVSSRNIGAKLEEKQINFLDAPVSGGEPGAISGELAIMVGGDEAVFAQAKPIFDAIGGATTLVGGIGAGTTAKLANQVMVNLNIAAMSEALVLAAKSGIDIDKMYQAIRSGLAGSNVLDAKVPLILDRNFEPGGKISINMKDLTNVMATAHDLDVPMPLSSSLLEIFHTLSANGHINEDHGAIVKYFENLANVTVTRETGAK